MVPRRGIHARRSRRRPRVEHRHLPARRRQDQAPGRWGERWSERCPRCVPLSLPPQPRPLAACSPRDPSIFPRRLSLSLSPSSSSLPLAPRSKADHAVALLFSPSPSTSTITSTTTRAASQASPSTSGSTTAFEACTAGSARPSSATSRPGPSTSPSTTRSRAACPRSEVRRRPSSSSSNLFFLLLECELELDVRRCGRRRGLMNTQYICILRPLTNLPFRRPLEGGGADEREHDKPAERRV